jgi:hypothetical protein
MTVGTGGVTLGGTLGLTAGVPSSFNQLLEIAPGPITTVGGKAGEEGEVEEEEDEPEEEEEPEEDEGEPEDVVACALRVFPSESLMEKSAICSIFCTHC